MPARKRQVLELEHLRGHLVQQSKRRWRGRVYDIRSGTVVRSVSRGTLAAARAALADAMQEVLDAETETNRLPVPTVRELLDRWLAARAGQGLARNTLRNDRRHAALAAHPLGVGTTITAMPVDEIGPEHVRALLTALEDAPYAAATRRKVLLAVRAAWDLAAGDRATRDHVRPEDDPTRAIRVSVPPKRARPLTDAEVLALLTAIDRAAAGTSTGWRADPRGDVAGAQVRAAAMWSVALWSGVRVGELCGLPLGQVDATRRLVATDWHAVTGDEGGWVLAPGTKSGPDRWVALTSHAWAHVEAWLAVRRRWRLAAGPAWSPSLSVDGDPVETLFATQTGRMVSPDNARRDLRRLLTDADLDGVHPHRLRDTLATGLLRLGVPARVAAGWLGHADLQMTGRYQAVVDQQLLDTRDQLEADAPWLRVVPAPATRGWPADIRPARRGPASAL